MKVTSLQLYFNDACPFDRKLFRKTFGRSAEVNIENMRKAVKAGLSVSYYVRYCMKRGSAKQELLETLCNQVRTEEDKKYYYELTKREQALLATAK